MSRHDRIASSIERARSTLGTNTPLIYELAANVIRDNSPRGGRLLDVGCGQSALWQSVGDHFSTYVGVDLVQHANLPAGVEFLSADLNAEPIPLADQSSDVVVSLGVIEYLENPRAFVRELSRVTKSSGMVLVSTSNHLSALSKLTLVMKNRFSAMQDTNPSHPITAVLESDLRTMADECGLKETQIHFTNRGRMPFSGRSWPGMFRGRAFSDVILLSARKP